MQGSVQQEFYNIGDFFFTIFQPKVITHNGALYVIGGDDGTSNLASVEMYSPKADTWTVLAANMTIGRSYTGVCVIDKPSFIHHVI